MLTAHRSKENDNGGSHRGTCWKPCSKVLAYCGRCDLMGETGVRCPTQLLWLSQVQPNLLPRRKKSNLSMTYSATKLSSPPRDAPLLKEPWSVGTNEAQAVRIAPDVQLVCTGHRHVNTSKHLPNCLPRYWIKCFTAFWVGIELPNAGRTAKNCVWRLRGIQL